VPGMQIGQVLVKQGVLTECQVAHILNIQRTSDRPFGDLAERMFGLSPRAVEAAWAEQYLGMAGVVDLQQQEVDADCLRLLNRRQAWQFRLLPLNRDRQSLNMATDAANLVRAVNFSARRIDEPIYMVIAEPQQLREFLMKYY